MDALFQSRAEELASEFAGQATTIEELNELMRLMLKSGLERMLNTEMDVHLGRRSGVPAAASSPSVPAGEKRRSPNRRNGPSKKTVGGVSDAETAQLSKLATSVTRYRGRRPLPQFFGTRP